MWINTNNNNEKIMKPRATTINGVMHPANIFTRWSDDELRAVGLEPCTISGLPNRRYYTSVEVKNFTVAPYSIGYTATERALSEVQDKMLKDLEEEANSRFNEAVKGYTPAEMSSWAELEAQAREHQVTPLTSGMLFDEATIAGITVDELAAKVIANADALKQMKSYIAGNRKRVATEIMALADVSACALYEATPYNYTITAEDIIEGDTAQVGDIVTRHKNNVKDW